LQSNAIAINQEKVSSDQYLVSNEDILQEKFVLVRKGKKDYQLVIIE
jgi:tyrosyl-tRNA synthetase